MRSRHRPYAGVSDLRRILDLLMECWTADPLGACDHVGDLLWGLRNPNDLTRNARLWEDATGGLRGFALVDPADGYLLAEVSPAARGDLAVATFDWGLDRLREAARDESGSDQVWTQAYDGNAERIAFLEARGFARDAPSFTELTYPLGGEIQLPELPAGFSLRSLAGAREVEAYVALHREAWSTWGPSSYTVESHQRLMGNPGYELDLNPIVVAPDGTLAASCICWLDPVNRIGEIEPLGTRPAYRRRGLARAIVLEALRRMQARGMASARVLGSNRNLPAQRLYASIGFRPARTIGNYRRAAIG